MVAAPPNLLFSNPWEEARVPEYTPAELVQKWEEFFSEFDYAGRILTVADAYPETRTLEVSFDELNRFDTDFAVHLVNRPQAALAAGEEAITRVAPAGDEPIKIHLRVKHLPRDLRILIRDLRAGHLGKFVTVEGLVRKATEVRPKVVDATFQCLRCNAVLKEPQEGQAFREPLECYKDQGGCERTAASTKFKLLGEASQYLDTQKIEAQEPPEILRGGEQPQRIEAYMEDDIAGTITPGERVVLNGILRSTQRGRPGARSTIFDIFVEVNSVEKERVEFEEIEVSLSDIERIREEAARPGVLDRIVQSIAPAIYGLEKEKEALALQLFGGVVKVLPDGTRVRGDSHVLLVGDPGSGKSQLLLYMSQLAPRGIMVSGKGTSAAGLTGAAVKDEFGEGRWTLEAGALVLSDRGVAIIDELEKMSPQDRGSIHQAMEEQMIHIAKAGITATLPARCAVLAAANPQFGRFVREKYIGDQINLEPALLSVAGDTPILVRENGLIRTTTMADIVDCHYQGEADAVPIQVSGLEVSSLDLSTLRIHWRLVSEVFRHRFPGKLLRLRLETGRTVTVTPGHSIYGFRNGRIAAIPGDQVRVGDFIATPRRLPAGEAAPKEFLLPRELMKLSPELRRGIYLHNVPRSAFSRLHEVPAHWVRDRKLSLERSHELTDDELRLCRMRVYGGSGAAVPTVVPVDGRLLRLLGYYIAEGSAFISASRSHVVSLALGPTDGSIVKDLGEISQSLFGSKLSVVRQGSGVHANLLGKIPYLFLVHTLGISRGAHQKRVPGIVFNTSPSLQLEFVRAYWAGDAGVTVSPHLMSDLLYLFLFQGTVASSYFDGKRRTAMLRGRPITSSGYYALASPRPPTFENRGITTRLPQRLMRSMFRTLSDADFARGRWGTAPFPDRRGDSISPRWWGGVLASRLGRRAARLKMFQRPTTQQDYEHALGLRAGGGQAFLLQWLRRGLLERHRSRGTSPYRYQLSDTGSVALGDFRFVERFAGSDVALVRVKTIEEVESTSYVYDLTVPGTENFVGGFGGVICHNSRFDCIFVVQDVPNPERDRDMAEHILMGHLLGEVSRAQEETGQAPSAQVVRSAHVPYYEPEFLRKYIAFAKRFYPVMTTEARERIRDHYLSIRKEAEGSTVPITPRQLEAFVRLAEASARARLSVLVDVQDADRAVGIIEYWLHQVASEPGAAGPIDIDIIATGMASSQRDQVIRLRDIITELGGTETGEGANHEDILEIAERRGLARDRVEAWLRKWVQDGDLYTPMSGRYKLVTRL